MNVKALEEEIESREGQLAVLRRRIHAAHAREKKAMADLGLAQEEAITAAADTTQAYYALETAEDRINTLRLALIV